ncbi:hypothetical protein STENM36S_08609 [Streptomyces tendae]
MSIGDRPSARCSTVGRKLKRPITDRPVNSPPAEDARKSGRRSSDRSIIGADARRSRTTNRAPRSTAAASNRPTGARSHPVPAQRQRRHERDQRRSERQRPGEVRPAGPR